jgi:EAL domain-containing protein (putative c-di-GMP-specific phosphodiesterase class I)
MKIMAQIANWIETDEHLSVIKQCGYNKLQGNVISKPWSLAEFKRLVPSH